MAFQSMVSGAECSTGSNPLSQLLKQQQTDRSLHAGPSYQQAAQRPNGLRTQQQQGPGGQMVGKEAEQFFGQKPGGGPGEGLMAMGALRRELEGAQAQHQPQSEQIFY